MSAASKNPRNWIKLGCFGVLGLGLLLFGWAGVLFGTAYLRGQDEIVETRELQAEPGEIGDAAAPGRVALDLTVGDFHIVAGEPGEPIHVEAEFDTRSYDLRESFTKTEGSGWKYRVSFVETAWFKDGGLRAVVGGSFPEITITLPPDVPIALEGSFGKGVARLALGGLWLTDVDLEFDRGVMMVDFGRPLAAPVERIVLRSRQGGIFTRALGNASPRFLEIDHRMGALEVDLHGQWVRDAEVRIASFMVNNEILLANNVEIEGLSRLRGPASPRRAELSLPTIDLSVSSLLGRVSVVECEE